MVAIEIIFYGSSFTVIKTPPCQHSMHGQGKVTRDKQFTIYNVMSGRACICILGINLDGYWVNSVQGNNRGNTIRQFNQSANLVSLVPFCICKIIGDEILARLCAIREITDNDLRSIQLVALVVIQLNTCICVGDTSFLLDNFVTKQSNDRLQLIFLNDHNSLSNSEVSCLVQSIVTNGTATDNGCIDRRVGRYRPNSILFRMDGVDKC